MKKHRDFLLNHFAISVGIHVQPLIDHLDENEKGNRSKAGRNKKRSETKAANGNHTRERSTRIGTAGKQK
jgi:hypothetical protein